MISVDTNVIIRLLTRDDEQQYKKAYGVFQKEDVFASDTVLLESEWVLRYAYKFSREQIADAFSRLLGLPNVYVANSVAIHAAIQWHAKGLDFADALHLVMSQHCHRMVSFDVDFIKRAKDLSSCPVSLP